MARPQRPAALRPGARGTASLRRTRSVRRASAGLTPTRAGALLVLLAAGAAIYGAVSSEAFAMRRVLVSGATWTPEAVIRDTIAVPQGENLFGLATRPLEERLAAIPAISSASVAVVLPDELRVTVVEREALLVWLVADRRLLVDGTGTLFGELAEDPSSAPPGAASLAVVDDRRAASADLGVGGSLDPVDLDAATRLGSLVPADLGSSAKRLVIRVDDRDGYTIRAQPAGWTAVFGFYTPTLRTPGLIPGQVRLLESLLVGREPIVLRVVLADDRNGTYIPRPTPTPAPSAAP